MGPWATGCRGYRIDREAGRTTGGKTVRTLRNVFRRKLRVLLTIFGITIGVLALVVMGSMAEKMNLLVSGGTKYYSDKVIVAAAGSASMFSSSVLSVGKLP